MKELPIGIQDFRSLIEGNYIYIDKTKDIFELLKGKYYFLSRPRRFGKSLLVSTLKEVFLGSKDLFKGLWIENKIEWTKHPVIHIDFTVIDTKDANLNDGLKIQLKDIARKNNIELEANETKRAFHNLINTLTTQYGKVVILIDEYDKPIIDYLDNIEKANEHREILKNFYSVVKSNDANIQFFFMTGVSKFSKVSVFSDLNHLKDITTHPRFATLLGYTQDEIGQYFSSEIETMLEVEPNIQQKIKEWYNGYSWDGENFVYNPFSFLNFIDTKRFNNYWFSTGTPTFLMELLKNKEFYLHENFPIDTPGFVLDKFTVESPEILPLLFQTGYLTIKQYDTSTQVLTLDFPNREVENAFSMHLLSQLQEKPIDDSGVLIVELSKLLKQGRVDVFIEKLKIVYKGIAYQNIENKESYYHSLFYLVVKLLGYFIKCEIPTSDGRIDAVIETDDFVYIIEFKLHSAEEALAQIKTKEYHLPFTDSGKKIFMIGIGFDTETKNVGEYLVEEAGV